MGKMKMYKGATFREVQNTLVSVMEECNPDRGNEGYAMAYARQALDAAYVGEALRTQLLYVLTNLNTWCGPRAREAKAVMRGFVAAERED